MFYHFDDKNVQSLHKGVQNEPIFYVSLDLPGPCSRPSSSITSSGLGRSKVASSWRRQMEVFKGIVLLVVVRALCTLEMLCDTPAVPSRTLFPTPALSPASNRCCSLQYDPGHADKLVSCRLSRPSAESLASAGVMIKAPTR